MPLPEHDANTSNSSERTKRPLRFPLLAKGLAMGVVLLPLTMALQLVSGIVAERAGRLHDAERGVAESLASAQLVLGPVLQRRCDETWIGLKGEGKEVKNVTEKREFVLSATPAALTLAAKVASEPRYRGIFKVNGYVLEAKLDATWNDLSMLRPQAEHAGSTLRCDAPSLFVAVGDVRGLRQAAMTVDGKRVAVQPGTGHASHPRGFHVTLTTASPDAPAPLQAEVSFDLVGTGELAFAPIGETTRVDLSSDWPHPSFAGRFLPTERTVNEGGFAASWRLSSLATSAPVDLRDGAEACPLNANATIGESASNAKARCVETFGVSFIDPVSTYVLSDRATKYGLLFIALTFVGVGLVEVLHRLRVHPVQYLLVGSAVAVFFLLLVSLSEHVAFGWAYLSASAACTLLLAFYGSFVLRGMRAGALFGVAIGSLYAVLFVLLQLEQSALVLGSVLLFTVLAGVMIATRRVDWYTLIDNSRNEPSGPAALPAQ